jgi:hypothetical protein
MRIVGPQTLTVGVPTSVSDPAEAGGNPSVACQVQNSSSYALNILAQGDVLSIQPFTAQTIEISGQPIVVTPLAGTGTGTCSLTFVFLLGVAANTGVQLSDGTWVETPPQQDGPLTAAAITAASQPPGVLFGPTALPVVGNAVAQSVAISNVTRSLYVNVITGAPSGLILGIEVIGDQSGFVYRQGPYYLNAPSTNGYLAVVPVSGVLDTSVTILLTNVPAGTATLSVYGDSTETPESVFYNGPVQANSAAGADGPILTGPARLLTISCQASSTVYVDAQLILNAPGELTFPPNTILAAAKTVAVINAGAVTYAYP